MSVISRYYTLRRNSERNGWVGHGAPPGRGRVVRTSGGRGDVRTEVAERRSRLVRNRPRLAFIRSRGVLRIRWLGGRDSNPDTGSRERLPGLATLPPTPFPVVFRSDSFVSFRLFSMCSPASCLTVSQPPGSASQSW